jgi:hypothetical protein
MSLDVDRRSNLENQNLTSSRELLWAVYAVIEALQQSNDHRYWSLAEQWQSWIDYTKKTAAQVSST